LSGSPYGVMEDTRHRDSYGHRNVRDMAYDEAIVNSDSYGKS
jgi:hypothetical protein